MDRKRNEKARGKRTLRQKTVLERDIDLSGQTVNLTRWRICPPKILTRLQFVKSSFLTSAGGATTSLTMRPNGPYDVDPTVASTAIAGFTEWAAIYGVNRVLRCRVKCIVINLEAFPIVCGFGYFPFVLAAGAFTHDEYGNKNCTQRFISPTLCGGDRAEYEGTMDLEKLFGIITKGDLTQFYGTSGSNPSTLSSWCLGIYSPTGALFTSGKGVAYNIRMEFDIEFSLPSTLTV
jgi:hypothetical protein